jgi:hypothetical protein
MRTRRSWPDDPVVREVREARAKLWKEAGGTIEGLMRLARERVARLKKGKGKTSRGPKSPTRGSD